jgi:ketosteroid isomerase-like protein
MSTENEVREASKRFYTALSAMAKGQNGPMVEIWSHNASVTTMHPIGGREVGWDAVRASFEGVGKVATGGSVELADQYIQIAGDVAYELGTERGQMTVAGETITIAQRVTNIYRRESGAWKMVHHHADLSPAMLDLLARLSKKS